MISHALGDEEYSETSEISGTKFTSLQSVRGEGVMSSYRCAIISPLLLKSNRGGSGYYSSDSAILETDGVEFSSSKEEYISSGKEVEFKDNMSAAYFPITINLKGSFCAGPIKSTWNDRTLAGDNGGTALKTSFEDSKSLVKEMSTKVSGSQTAEDLGNNSAGSFEASMKLNSAFNGIAKLNTISKDSIESVPTTMLDEYYSGAFSLVTDMNISAKSKKKSSEDDYLSCCFGGYADMNPLERENNSKECLFNCSLDLAKEAS